MNGINRFLAIPCLLFTLSFASFNIYARPYKNYKGEVPIAIPACNTECLNDGFYLGLGIGYDDYKTRQNLNASTTLAGVTTGILRENPALNPRGFVGDLFVGFGKYVKDLYYFGLEIFGTASAADTSKSVAPFPTISVFTNPLLFNTKIYIRDSYGVSFLPGVKLDDYTLIYARLGFIRTNFKDQETFTALGTTIISASATNWSSGEIFGVGLERSIYDNFSVRGEYSYSTYNSFTNTFRRTGTFLSDVVTLRSNITPYNNQVMLSLIYHIA